MRRVLPCVSKSIGQKKTQSNAAILSRKNKKEKKRKAPPIVMPLYNKIKLIERTPTDLLTATPILQRVDLTVVDPHDVPHLDLEECEVC